MKTLRIPLRVVFYKCDGDWVAHCLEFDLCGDGATPREAIECLNEMIVIQVREVMETGNVENLFSPADGSFFRMFAAGRPHAVGDLKLEFHEDPIEIESYETREYSDEYADCDLVPA